MPVSVNDLKEVVAEAIEKRLYVYVDLFAMVCVEGEEHRNIPEVDRMLTFQGIPRTVFDVAAFLKDNGWEVSAVTETWTRVSVRFQRAGGEFFTRDSRCQSVYDGMLQTFVRAVEARIGK